MLLRGCEMTATGCKTVLESSALIAPVTALEFLGDDFLLTGEGPNLSIFSLQASPRQCTSLSVLQNYRIHGIRPKQQYKCEGHFPESSTCDDNMVMELVVFGGKGLRLINFRPCGNALETAGPLMELQDWVLDVSWLRGEIPLLGVPLAHNAALLLEPQTGKVLTLCSCVEACLLYSALLIGPSWEATVLVGGTVFNQLVLWRPSAAAVDNRSQVERRLLGHNGVIFSVCYLQSSGWLASASDDRSVRVWHVGKLGGNGGCGEESATCLQVLYGHQARVFCVKLSSGQVFSAGEDGACLLWEGDGRVARTLKGHRSGGIRALAVSKGSVSDGSRWVATGGADGGIRLWQVLEQSSERKESEHLTDLRFCGPGAPKVIRSAGDHDILVCTDEGKVFLHQDGSWKVLWNGGPEFQSYCIMEVTCIRLHDSDENVWMCAVANLNGGVQVFPLHQPDAGMFLQAGEGKIHSLQWVKVQHADVLSWCLLASGLGGLVCRWTVVLDEDETGLVLMLEKMKPFLLPQCAKRWLTAAVRLPSGKDALWVCGDRRGSLLLYKEEEKYGKDKDGKDTKERVDEGECMENTVDDNIAPISPVSILFGIHGKQGVTSVCEHQGLCYSTGRDGIVRVLSIKRDSLNVHRTQRACKGMEWLEKVLFLHPSEAELHCEKQVTRNDDCEERKERIEPKVLENEAVDRDGSDDVLPEAAKVKEKWPERNRNGDTERENVSEASFVMAGFHSVQFVLWDPLRQEKLFSVACGGGHRSWAYISSSCVETHLSNNTLRQGTLVFIKQGAVMASRSLTFLATEVRDHTLKEGLHGRGLGCVCHLGRISKADGSSDTWEVLVTGGEDTTVTVLAVKPEQDIVKVLATIADHISNVRTLAAVLRGEKEDRKNDRWTDSSATISTLLFSAGGRAQLQCYHLLISWDEQFNWPVCHVSQISGHRLDEQWERKRNRHKTVKMHPETRYMSMAVVHDGIEEVFLALACSDGAVRLFTVGEHSRKFELLWESFYHQRCVLSVASCSLEDPHGKEHVLLFSGATDGAVALWDLTTELDSKSKDSWHGPSAPCFSVPVHQSGVNTLLTLDHHVGQMTKDVITLASGGDDGQLSVLKFRMEFNQPETASVCPRLVSHWSVPLAHSSPLTALSALSSTLLVSTSPDQRVCVWRLCDDGLHHECAIFSHTADASGLWVWQRKRPISEDGAYVVVCGQGLQVLKLTVQGQEEGKETEGITHKEQERQKVVFADFV